MLVRFDDVTFAHPGRPPVLSHLNLSVQEGEVVAVVGRSGAGKTTVIKLVNRLLLPTTGTVTVEGRDTRSWDGIRLRRRVGYVIQDVGLFPHMTVEENITVVPRLERWPLDRARTRAHELLDLVGLPAATYGSRRPHELSGGQRQRVGLARALAVNPPILLMDEPFGALDPVTRMEIRREFVRIQQQLHITVIIVTHDMAEAFALGHRVCVVDSGEVVICDTPTRVFHATDPRVKNFLDTIPAPFSDAPAAEPEA